MKPLLLGLAVLSAVVNAQDKAAPPAYFEQRVAESNPLRVEQAGELDAYINQMKADPSRLQAVLAADYSSPAAFAKSAQAYRQAFCDSIGYPPPGLVPTGTAAFDKLGEDSLGTYYRAKFAVLPGVHAEGLYIVPKGLTGKAPLIISMHGGVFGLALFHGLHRAGPAIDDVHQRRKVAVHQAHRQQHMKLHSLTLDIVRCGLHGMGSAHRCRNPNA